MGDLGPDVPSCLAFLYLPLPSTNENHRCVPPHLAISLFFQEHLSWVLGPSRLELVHFSSVCLWEARVDSTEQDQALGPQFPQKSGSYFSEAPTPESTLGKKQAGRVTWHLAGCLLDTVGEDRPRSKLAPEHPG